MDLYRQLFPIPQIVNQIDHAAVTAVPTGATTSTTDGSGPAQPTALS